MQSFLGQGALAAAVAGLVACGGGGGGGGYPDVGYSGVTNQASVSGLTPSQQGEYGTAMLEGSADASQANPYGAELSTSASGAGQQRIWTVKAVAQDAVHNLLGTGEGTGQGMVSGASQTVGGSCGGSASVSDNSGGGRISGSIVYSNYCESAGYDPLTGAPIQLTLYGRVDISGTYSGTDSNPTPVSVTLSVPYLKTTIGNGSSTTTEVFSGTMTVAFDGTGQPSSVSMSVDFENGGKTYGVQDLRFDGASLSGRLYHPEHGWVDVTTTVPFSAYGDQYCGGTLQMSAADGTMEFTANSTCENYTVCFTPTGGAQSCSSAQAW